MSLKESLQRVLVWVFLVGFIASPLSIAHAQQIDCHTDTDNDTLIELIECIDDAMPAFESNGFSEPSDAQHTIWQNVVTRLLRESFDGDCTTNTAMTTRLGALADIYHYWIFPDTATGKNYCVLMEIKDGDSAAEEDGTVDTGFGTLIVNPIAKRELSIQVPHPSTETGQGGDFRTHLQGIEVFQDTESRSFLMAGAHRHANERCSSFQYKSGDAAWCNIGEAVTLTSPYKKYTQADVSHNKDNFFHTTVVALDSEYARANKKFRAIQFHVNDVDDCPDIYLSHGTKPTTVAAYDDTPLERLKANLDDVGWSDVEFALDGGDCDKAGTLNVQGRYLNGATTDMVLHGRTSFSPLMTFSKKFIHIEQKPSALAGDTDIDNWSEAINKTWPIIDVILVLDSSGSMLRKPDGCSSCETKKKILEDAVGELMSHWRAIKYSLTDDQFGITYFKRTATELAVSGQNLISVQSDDALTLVDRFERVTVDSADTTGIGGGLITAIERLTADSTGTKNIILLTDGIQNESPKVLNPGTSVSIEAEGGRTELTINSALEIQINTIGIDATGEMRSLLQDIADATDGLYRSVRNMGTHLRSSLLDTLFDSLRGASPQLVADRSGTHADSITIERFRFNDSVEKIALSLKWPKENHLQFRIKRNGTDVTSFGSIISQANYRIFSIVVPKEIQGQTILANGNWEMEIFGDSNVDYQVAAMVEEKSWDFDVDFDSSVGTVGRPLNVTVALSYLNKTIENATITAKITRPQHSLGTLLSTTPSSAPSASGEPKTSPGSRKLYALLENDEFIQHLEPLESHLEFTDNGDGTYSSSFDKTTIPGAYTFEIEVRVDSEEFGSFHRTKRVSRLVKFDRAEIIASDLSSRKISSSGTTSKIVLSVRPQDRFGNYLGPDAADQISVNVSAGSVDLIQDLLDGTYNIHLSVPEGSDSLINLLVSNNILYSGLNSALSQNALFVGIGDGIGIPIGSFFDKYSPSISLGAHLGYRLSDSLQIYGALGVNALKHKNSGADDSVLIDFSSGIRFELVKAPLQVALRVGAGLYSIDLRDSHLGIHGGIDLVPFSSNGFSFGVAVDYQQLIGIDGQLLSMRVGLGVEF